MGILEEPQMTRIAQVLIFNKSIRDHL